MQHLTSLSLHVLRADCLLCEWMQLLLHWPLHGSWANCLLSMLRQLLLHELWLHHGCLLSMLVQRLLRWREATTEALRLAAEEVLRLPHGQLKGPVLSVGRS